MTEFALSSRSIGVLAEAIAAAKSATEMDTLFLKADVDGWEPEHATNKLDRAVKLLKNLRLGVRQKRRSDQKHPTGVRVSC
jgi:hypothetical protein